MGRPADFVGFVGGAGVAGLKLQSTPKFGRLEVAPTGTTQAAVKPPGVRTCVSIARALAARPRRSSAART